MGKKLYRSRENKMIAGVCGGIAEYFQVDPTIVRIILAAVTLANVPGVIVAYIIAAVVIPEKQGDFSGSKDQQNYQASQNEQGTNNYNTNDSENGKYQSSESSEYDSNKTRLLIGGGLVVLGVLFIAKEFFFFDWKYMWPLIFIGIGTYIIYKGGRK